MGAPTERATGLGWRTFMAAGLVASVVLLAFRHSLGHEFVNWDDDVYVHENPALRLPWPQAVAWIFSHFYYYAYIPVTLLSHWIDVRLWGMDPQGHHLTNVLLHAANSIWILALGLLLSRELRPGPRNPRAALLGMTVAAILFAVHPLRAESVSWVSDRKDLLCAFFFLPGVFFYLHATREGAAHRFMGMLASLLLFVLAVLSKSIAVVFPIVALLLDWARGRRGRIALLEKIPFILVSLVIVAVSLAHTRGATAPPSNLQGTDVVSFPFYALVLSFPLLQSLAPVNLAPIYPRVGPEWTIVAFALVTVVTALAVVTWRKGSKVVLAAWLTYFALVIPNVVGLSSGMQPLADRYSYASTMPLYWILGAGLGAIWARGTMKRRLALAVASGSLAAALMFMTVRQTSIWRSSISLWEHVVANHPARREYRDAYLNLGAAYAQAGRHDDAAAALERAVAADPGNAEAHHNLGVISYLRRDHASALAHLRKATELDPRHGKAFYYRALAAGEMKLNEESVAAMVQAARLGSKDAREALAAHAIPW